MRETGKYFCAMMSAHVWCIKQMADLLFGQLILLKPAHSLSHNEQDASIVSESIWLKDALVSV